jgi:hypothetical protein
MTAIEVRDHHLAAAGLPLDDGPNDLDAVGEPSAEELAAIEAEWPLIAAELELVAAECWVELHPGPVSETALRDAREALAAAAARAVRSGGEGVPDGRVPA